MTKIYPFLMVLNSLLLAGCGRERTTQEAATVATAPTPTDTTRVVPVPAVSPADSAAALPVTTKPISDSKAMAAHGAARPIPENQPVLRVKRGATVFADVPAEPMDEVALVDNKAAPIERSNNTAELTRFLQAGLPAAQLFRIRPGRDTLVTGAQGTQLLVPARVWDLPDSTSVVQLTVQEFYKATDMILAGLSTTAGPQLLETGGMLHITATANGQPVKLRPGAYVHLRMPAKEKKPDMQLFEGVMNGPNQAVDWQVPPPVQPTDSSSGKLRTPAGMLWQAGVGHQKSRRVRHRKLRDLTHASWPDYEGGDKQLLEELEGLIDYPEATRTRLRRTRRITRAENTKLIEASKRAGQRILRVVQVRFVLDTTGVISQAQAETDDATTDKQLNKVVVAAVAQLSGWNEPAVQPEYPLPGVRRLVPVAAARHLTVLFPEKGPVIIKMGEWLNETRRLAKLNEEQRRLIAQQKQHIDDSLYRANKPYFDSLAAVAQRRAAVRAAAELVRLRTQFTDTSRAAISEMGVYNELSTQKLQWVNCDRFVSPKAQVNYVVVRPKDAVVKLLFRKWQSIVSDDNHSQESVAWFHSAPLNQSVTIVALRRENGITYLAVQETSITETPLKALSFHPVTMAELRTELARLN